MSRRAAFAALWCLAGSLGCSQDAPSRRAAPATDAQTAGVVVARVNGEAIVRAQVQRLCEVSGLSPKEALKRLVSESLLAQYAEARGYAELPSVQRELKRARVRALLAEQVERGTEPEAIAPAQVRARQEAHERGLKEPAVKGEAPAPEAHLRSELSVEARRARLEMLLRQLQKRYEVVYHEQAIRDALATDVALATGT